MQLRDCSKRESSVEGLKGSNTVTVHSPERQHSSIFPDRLGHGVQGVEHLPGFINTIIIRLDENPSLTMRRVRATVYSVSRCAANCNSFTRALLYVPGILPLIATKHKSWTFDAAEKNSQIVDCGLSFDSFKASRPNHAPKISHADSL